MMSKAYDAWPELPYEDFKSTGYLLHRTLQILGKLKLNTPFEPHWGNVGLWLTSRGLTTGPIPYHQSSYSIDIDFFSHQIVITTGWNTSEVIHINTASVAEIYQQIFQYLKQLGIQVAINVIPKEVSDPIPFDQDIKENDYNKNLANAFWRILMSSYRVLQRFHAKFTGRTPPVAFMWGTFDLRDARYLSKAAPNIPKDYIERNAFDVFQIESGFWPGDARYPKPAYFSLTFPLPLSMENEKVQPEKAYWHKTLSEFILDYDALRLSKNPEEDLLNFFETTYDAGAKLSGWDPKLVSLGKPV